MINLPDDILSRLEGISERNGHCWYDFSGTGLDLANDDFSEFLIEDIASETCELTLKNVIFSFLDGEYSIIGTGHFTFNCMGLSYDDDDEYEWCAQDDWVHPEYIWIDGGERQPFSKELEKKIRKEIIDQWGEENFWDHFGTDGLLSAD